MEDVELMMLLREIPGEFKDLVVPIFGWRQRDQEFKVILLCIKLEAR